MRLKVPALVVAAMLGAITAAQAQTQTQTHKRTTRATANTHPTNRVIVTHRSYLDPGPEPLPQERMQSRQYIFPLSLNQYNPGYRNPTDPTGSRFWPLSDPFWPYWP
jgi:hypothetical protein